METENKAENITVKGTIEYEIELGQTSLSFKFEPNNDNTGLISLLIAEEIIKRAKESMHTYLKTVPFNNLPV